MSKKPANVFLDELRQETETLIETANMKFSELSIKQLVWQPNDNTWSINQCLEHLNLVGKYYITEIDKTIESKLAEQEPPAAYYSSGLMGRLAIKTMALNDRNEAKLKMKTPGAYNPPIKEIMNNDVLKEFFRQQNQLIKLCEKSKMININKSKIPVMIAKALKFRLGDMLAFIVAHNKRHVAQAEKVVDHRNFPRK